MKAANYKFSFEGEGTHLVFEVPRTSSSHEGCRRVAKDDTLSSLIHDILKIGFEVCHIVTSDFRCNF